MKKNVIAALTAFAMFTAAFPQGVSAAIMGDVDGDESISIADATAVLSIFSAEAAEITLSETQQAQYVAADVSGDGIVDTTDATAILTYFSQDAASLFPDWNEILFGKALAAPEITYAVNYGDTMTLDWSICPGASGYEVYKIDLDLWEPILIASIIGDTNTTCDVDVNPENEYDYYYIRSFVNRNGEVIYGDESEWKSSTSPDALLNAAVLQPHNDFVCYDRSTNATSTEVLYSFKLSAADRAILDAFAAEHFTEDMTRYDKLYYTASWIHDNVNYAYVGEKWNAIVNKTLVDAVFTHHLGQCLQYNGAMIGMMAYMGYDVHLIFEKNGNWQHFSGVVVLNGKEYPIEAGNWEDGKWVTIVS